MSGARRDGPLLAWFAARGWKPAAFQRETWRRYLAGESGLLHTPTGSGKTLAAFGGPLLEALADPAPARAAAGEGPRVLWVTPLRALAADTTRALAQTAAELGLAWTVALRTGDASARDKRLARQGKADVLVITPESLALLLSYADASQRFRALRGIVVDEWHELLGNKRGVLLQLCLARLRCLSPGARTWGLSATLGNLDQARAVLLPHAPDSALVAGARPRKIQISTLLPERSRALPWAGHLGLSQLERVFKRLFDVRATLLFTNTRAQAELWHRALESIWPEAPGTLALHHGSLDPKLRAAVEQGLRDGTMRCVVATSSLDLGVDFPAVDQVLQIGSPKGVARLLQRAGRARHRPGESGNVVCVPAQALELIEYAAARQAIARGEIESRPPPVGSLDVLAQHAVTLALGGGFDADTLYQEVRGTHAYAALDRATWQAVLDFIVQGGRALAKYPDYQRVVRDEDGRYRVHDRRVAFRHRLSIGTITADGAVAVKYLRGGSLGSVEEGFLARLRRGDRFQFAGRTLELVRLEGMVAYVRRAKGGDGPVATWQGGRMPLSTQLASEVESLYSHPGTHPEMRAVAPLLRIQAQASALPDRGAAGGRAHRHAARHASVPVSVRRPRRARRHRGNDRAALGPAAGQHDLLYGQRLRVDADAGRAGRAGRGAAAPAAQPRTHGRRPARRRQPGRNGAPPVPRDRARGGPVDAFIARPGGALAAAGAGLQRAALRRAAPLRSGPPAAGASRARSVRTAVGGAPPAGGVARLPAARTGAVRASRADAPVVPAVDRKHARATQHRDLAGARQARRAATGEAL